MPFTWTTDPARGLVTVTATGLVDYESSVQLLQDLLASPDFSLRYGILADLRAAETAATLEEINAFADMMAQLGFFKGRTALVVSSTFTFGHGRQLSTFGGERGVPVEVFTSIRGALRWLGVPE